VIIALGIAVAIGSMAPTPRLPSLQVGERVTLIRETPFEQKELDVARAMNRRALAEHYQKLGYHRIDAPERTLLFSPGLWQEDAHVAARGLYGAIEAAVGQSGLIDGDSSPQLRAFIDHAFGGAFGFENPSAARYAMEPRMNVRMSDGKKPIPLPLHRSTPKEILAGLNERPLGEVLPPEKRASPSPWPRLLLVVDLHVTAFGSQSLMPAIRMADVADATRILTERLRETSAAAAALSDTLLARGLAEDLSPGMVGKGDRLPERFARQIESRLQRDFKQFGFASENDANAWLANARVSRAELSWSLTARDPRSLVSHSIPRG
jgi:hypothetical protein